MPVHDNEVHTKITEAEATLAEKYGSLMTPRVEHLERLAREQDTGGRWVTGNPALVEHLRAAVLRHYPDAEKPPYDQIPTWESVLSVCARAAWEFYESRQPCSNPRCHRPDGYAHIGPCCTEPGCGVAHT